MRADASLPWREPSAVTRDLLALLELPGVGVGALRRIAPDVSPDMEAPMWNALARLRNNLVHDPAALDSDPVKGEVSQLVQECAALRVNILSFADPEYPAPLRSISDFPPIIYVKGSVEALTKSVCVAVVGTRKSSPVGEAWARKIAKTLVQESVTVVSGLALGIDTCAHEGALEGGGVTVAILAHGLDTVSPARNRVLASRILEQRGALVSEHRPGTPPRPAEFVRRNRIQSGLSVASIVVESATEGGAIHQANFTTAQHRVLFAALPPKSVQDSHGFNDEGSRFLIDHRKARPLRSEEQLRSEIRSLKESSSFLKTARISAGARSDDDQPPLPLIG